MVTGVIALGPELDWLPDDTEESLLGTSVHQMVIVSLDNCIDRVKRQNQLPWFIGNQLKMIIPRGRGRAAYYPSPDIIIHATLGGAMLSSLAVAQDGPPALAIEVASPDPPFGRVPRARAHDLDTFNPAAKPRAYEQGGIAEYLVYDPLGTLLPERVRAWRIGAAGVYEPWLPAADGRWHSALGISFAPERDGLLLRVYGPDGQLVPTNAEMDDIVAALEAELRRRSG